MTHELAVGGMAPMISGVDEGGRVWNLRDFRGRAVAVTFIYTRCPLPTYCPLMSRNFALARSILAKLAGDEGERFQFISVSLDAAHDTPAVLTEYAKAFRTERKGWLFARIDDAQLRPFGEAFGLEFRDNGSAIDHNLRTIVIDRSGRVKKNFRGNTWTPQELASEMLRSGAS